MEIKKHILAYRNGNNMAFTYIYKRFESFMHHLSREYEYRFQDAGIGGYDEMYSLLQVFLYESVIPKIDLNKSEGEIYKYVNKLLRKRARWSYLDGVRANMNWRNVLPESTKMNHEDYINAMWDFSKHGYLAMLNRFELKTLLDQLRTLIPPHGRRKLSSDIYAVLYENPSISQAELSKIFNCDRSTIRHFYHKLKSTLRSVGVDNVRHCISTFN